MYHPVSWDRAQPAWDYIWRLMEYQPPYGWWGGGVVESEAPAWAVNESPPDPSQITSLFCVAVGNLMLRALEMFDEGYIIPTSGYDEYDGGTVAVENYYGSYGTLEPFDLEFAKAHSGTICFCSFNAANNSEGHWMVSWKNWAVHSFPNDASGEPGLNWDYTVEQSHDGGYYQYMIRPWNWLPITEDRYYELAAGEDGRDTAQFTTERRGMPFTAELLTQAMTSPSWEGPDLDLTEAQRYLPHLISACKKWEINTRERLSAFLAQTGTESGSFKWWREFSRGTGKEFGYWYGRGPIQLTWEANYQRFQNDTGTPAHDDAEIVADDPAVGFDAAGWFWRRGNGDLNELADQATWPSFYEITGRVWGQSGPFHERDARYDHAWNVLPEDLDLSTNDAAEITQQEPWMGFTSDPEQWVRGVNVPSGSWLEFPEYTDGKRYVVLRTPEEDES